MKGIFNFRIILLLIILIGFYLILCDFGMPVKNLGKNDVSVAYVDSVKKLDLFDYYSYDQIYYHFRYNDRVYLDSVTESRYAGTVNQGDSLLVVISKVNPKQHSVKSIYGRSQDPIQVMSR